MNILKKLFGGSQKTFLSLDIRPDIEPSEPVLVSESSITSRIGFAKERLLVDINEELRAPDYGYDQKARAEAKTIVDTLRNTEDDLLVERLVTMIWKKFTFKPARNALVTIGDPRTINLLCSTLGDIVKREYWSKDVEDMLDNIDGNWRTSEAAVNAIPNLLIALQNNDKEVRSNAIKVLGTLRNYLETQSSR